MRKVIASLFLALAVSGLGMSCVQAQITWDKQAGSWSWDQNQTFMSELTQSVRQFFGTAVGAYISRSQGTPNSRQDTARPVISPEKWAMISTQFFGGPATGEYSRGTILDGRFRIYAFFTGNGPITAFVMPIHEVRVVAAAIDGGSCGALAPNEIGDASAFKGHFSSPQCQEPAVTIFFKDKFDLNPQIRDALRKLMSRPYLEQCKAILDSVPAQDRSRSRSLVPFCRFPVDVVMLDQLPRE